MLDIFGGSNTTGQVAEHLKRKWLTFELSKEYVAASVFRFTDNPDKAKEYYDKIIQDKFISI